MRLKIKKLFQNIDKPLFFVMCIIIIFGLLNIVTASSRETVVRYDQSLYHYFFQHSLMLTIALIGSVAIINVPTKYYKLIGPVLYLISLGLLIYLSVTGTSERGSVNWLSIAGFTFQPSELAKPVMIVCLALTFEFFYKKLRNTKLNHYDIIGFILLIGLIMPVIVFLQGDLGTCLIILGIFAVMFIASPVLKIDKFKTCIFMLIVGLIGVLGIYSIKGYILTDAQLKRFDFFNPCSKYEKSGYQICNGFIAINSGGLLGVGIGNSTQKSYIPESHTDSVFAIIAEEYGFLITTVILFLYIVVLYRILRLASLSGTVRGKYICYGISLYIFLHILVNLGGLFGSLPLTGVPLPFLSYGGSFTLSLTVALAIVQRIHIEYKNEKIRI